MIFIVDRPCDYCIRGLLHGCTRRPCCFERALRGVLSRSIPDDVRDENAALGRCVEPQILALAHHPRQSVRREAVGHRAGGLALRARVV